MMPRPRLLLFLVACTLLSACSPVTGQGQPSANRYVALSSRVTLGQTFFSRHRGLEGIKIYLAPNTRGAGTLQLSLRASPQSDGDLASATLPVASVTSPGFYRFSLPPQTASSRHDYYLLLQIQGTGSVLVGEGSANTYLDGAAYLNGNPTQWQLAFGLDYQSSQFLIGLTQEALGWLALLLPAGFLFVVPGWALIDVLLGPDNPLSRPEKLGLAAGTSVALYPLLLVWTDLVGLHIGPAYAWLPGLVGIGVLGARGLKRWKSQAPPYPAVLESRSISIRPINLAFLIVLGLVFLVRFYAVRGLTVPLWGDSLQHTMIAQLIVNNGGLFRSWQPYSDLTSFTYNFGFHSAVAAFHWVTNQALPLATLNTGQILNGVAVLALFPLATRATRNAWAGLGAVLVAGLLAPMPMSLTNTGHYTELAGMAILPAAVCIGLLAVEEKPPRINTIVLGGILWAGLGLASYRMLLFAALLWPAYLLLRLRHGSMPKILMSFASLALAACLLLLPWFARLFSGGIISWASSLLQTPTGTVTALTQQYNAGGSPLDYLPAWLWALAVLGLIVALWQHVDEAALYTVWWGSVFLAANPGWLGLPGDGLLSSSAALVAVSIPAAVMAGCLPVCLHSMVTDRYRLGQGGRSLEAEWTLVLLAIVLGAIGSVPRVHDLVPNGHALVTRADLRAMAWIQQHTPPNAKFLVSSYPVYGNSMIVGSDAGWWLPLLANRQASTPPAEYVLETGPFPQYRIWVNLLGEAVQTHGVGDRGVEQVLAERGIGYVYIGQLNGDVDSGAKSIYLRDLLSSRMFCPLYHQDHVWVFGFAASCASPVGS